MSAPSANGLDARDFNETFLASVQRSMRATIESFDEDMISPPVGDMIHRQHRELKAQKMAKAIDFANLDIYDKRAWRELDIVH